MKKIFLPVILLALAPFGALAQSTATPNTPTLNGLPRWICVSPGGQYEVALKSMVSVSWCEYIVDNVARVTEANIDTTGNMAIRFYYIEPMTPNSPIGLGQSTIDKLQDAVTAAEDRTGQDAWKKVIKTYPTTTHAHTIEYRVDSKDDLIKIFNSAETAFSTQQAAVCTVPGS